MSAIILSLDTSRDDKGKTANYHVYAATETMQVTNGKGQAVTKPVIMGGNSTIYVGNPVAQGIDAWVLMPRNEYEILLAANKQGTVSIPDVNVSSVTQKKTTRRKK